ncbi:hypothetical protein Zm00014a_023040 [Zea mays]|jgi:hypothetical protein|uniref:Uncharacterized protein n=1 Tax=Zea mays TaxID=4577 RepID=A0A3L6DMN3_MAIZE|nr:hypothetical protein Zm00014a_023040 [Zea mays]
MDQVLKFSEQRTLEEEDKQYQAIGARTPATHTLLVFSSIA